RLHVLWLLAACARGPIVEPGESVVDEGVLELHYSSGEGSGEERFAIIDRAGGGHAIHAETRWSRQGRDGHESITIFLDAAWQVGGGRVGTLETEPGDGGMVSKAHGKVLQHVKPSALRRALSFLAPLCLHQDEHGKEVAIFSDQPGMIEAS